MGDPIKQKLKHKKTKIRASAETDDFLVAVPDNNDLVRRIHNVNVGTPYAENPSLRVIDHYVNRINKNQKHLEKVARLDSSILYRSMTGLSDLVLKLFGRQTTRQNIYELFVQQQENVRNLNNSLTGMVRSYTDNLDKVEATLYNNLDDAAVESEKRNQIEKSISPELKRYEIAKNRLDSIDRDRQPRQYYDLLKRLIDVESSVRKKGFSYNKTSFGKKHYESQIENLKLQKALFEMTLYRVMEMAVKTEFYQQALDNNFMAWQPIVDLSKVVGIVSDGVAVLSEYNKQLNDTYIRAVKDISEVVDEHPGIPLIMDTNEELRQLVSDVNSNNLRDALTYND